MPRTAVVLCSHQGARFLPAQLGSLRAQTVQPEIYVLSDDASADGSFDLLQRFADDRRAAGCTVILHRNAANLGFLRHFEQALQRSDAELLFPCDQDDVWHPSKLERMRAEFAARPDLLVLHADARLVDADSRSLDRRLFQVLDVSPGELAAMHAGHAFEVLLRRNMVTGATMAFRREALQAALPFVDGWAHDEWIAIQAALRGRVDTLDEVLVDYRQHEANQIGVRARHGAQKLGIGMDRQAFLRRAEQRQQALSERAARGPLPDPIRDALDQRLLHARHRANLPAAFAARLPAIWSEARSGRYARFGRGWRSALADLFGID